MAESKGAERKSPPIPGTILEPTSKQNFEHKGLKNTAVWILGLVILYILLSTLVKGCKSTATESTAINTNSGLTRTPPEYVRETCTDDAHTKVFDYSGQALPIGTKITIPLHEGCFANTYVLPANRIYWMQKTKTKGDWAAAWCNGNPEPPTMVQPYYLDMQHSMDNCFAHGRISIFSPPADTSPHFSLQGKGSITFIVTAYKTVFG